MRFLDTNIILDLFGPSNTMEASWSRDRYGDALEAGDVVYNVVILAELASRAASLTALSGRLAEFEIEQVDLTDAAAFVSGTAFREYRRRGGERKAILTDFLIAGHAASMKAALVTRDRRLTSYFPELSFITPETHP